MSGGQPKPLTVVILSGGTGRTADQVVAAALAQFDEPQVNIARKTDVRSVRSATAIVRQAAKDHAILCHTLVAPKLRAAVAEQSQRLGVPAIDILGPFLTALDDHLDVAPHGEPGLSYELGKEQFDRIDAVDFTLAHDDARRIADLEEADVVIVGVSRASKSVTCFYLASRGIRAANVPLLPGRAAPDELVRLKPNKVIGLTMNANRLSSVRDARLPHLTNEALPEYVDTRTITAELRHASDLMRRHKWRCIDVSYKATEEVVAEVIELLAPRARKAAS